MKELFESRKLIWKLSKNDFKTRFAGSTMGRVWAFVQPVITVLMYYVVFDRIFKAKADFAANGMETPYVLWLTAGLVPWFFFNEAIINGMNSLLEYNYLVKKVVFKIDILPMIKVISSVFIHAFFAIVLLIMYFLYGFKPGLAIIQLIYYSFCLFLLSLAISYTTCAVIVFFRDLSQIVNITMQLGMWATPILWNLSIVPEKYRFLFYFNPVYYVVSGYRGALFDETWVWQRGMETGIFWGELLVFFVIGAIVFKKLRVHFADVL